MDQRHRPHPGAAGAGARRRAGPRGAGLAPALYASGGTPPHLTAEQIGAAFVGALQVRWRGQPFPLVLDPAEQEALLDATTRGLLVTRAQEDAALANAFDVCCFGVGAPITRVVLHAAGAALLVLLTDPSDRLDAPLAARLGALVAEAAPDAVVRCTARGCLAAPLPRSTAAALGARVAAALREPVASTTVG